MTVAPLHEYQSLFVGEEDIGDHRAVSQKIFDEIERFVLENAETTLFLKPGYKRGLGKVLQAQNHVGVIQTRDGTTIEILPKIRNAGEAASRAILIRMLKTLRNSPFKSLHKAHLKTAKLPLFEIFVTMFLEELALLVRRGIRSDYLAREDNLPYLKGKLKLREQIRHNRIHKERFFVRYDEYNSDRVENRLIKSTLHFLYKKSRSSRNQQRIREFLFVFDAVSPSRDPKTDLAGTKNDRQMRDYEQVLRWCRTFLLGESFSPYRGRSVAFALLFDMNRLFESYVGHYLQRRGFQVRLQDRRHHLAYQKGQGRFQLKPDIVIVDKNIIADTKWKIISPDKPHQGVAQADMYQLHAYGTKYRSKSMYLIYPMDVPVAGNRYDYFRPDEHESIKLNVVFFDLKRDRFVRGR